MVTADSASCLLVYPLPDWEPIQESLMGLSSFNPRTRDLQRRWSAMRRTSRSTAPDASCARPRLRKFAGLDKDVVLVGQGAKFELWDEAKWERRWTSRSR